MATGTTDKGEKNAGNVNSAFSGTDDPNLPNGFQKSEDGIPSFINIQVAGKKWLGFAKTRRYANDYSRLGLMSRQSSKRTKHLGLDPDVFEEDSSRHASDKKKLDQELIKHFVNLARDNDYEDEVDINFIEELLSKGANINCSDKYGQSVLHEAARAWHTDIARFLLDRGADINKADRFGRTALHIAAATDYPEMVQLLLEKGANLEALTKEENQTPLHFAARNDASEALKVLLKLDANIEAKDYKNRTPLFVAAELDRSDTARFLIDVDADATVVDSTGQLCMTSMITNMGPVARQALNQFHYKDRANRRQYYYLNLLESTKKNSKKKTANDDEEISLAKSPLDVIVYYKQLDLIMHPVIMRMIDVKWNQFGRRGALKALALNIIFVLIWTILGVGVPWYTRYQYIFPTAGWRVLMLILGMMFALYNVGYEVMEILLSRQRFEKWKNWRGASLKKDLKFCHAKWPEEEKYLKRQIESMDDLLPNYFQDFWNYFDWAVYLQIFLVFITHIVDIAISPGERVAPCCSINNSTFCIDVDCRSDIAQVNNASLALWNNRFHVVLIISLWLRIMKDTRAFRFLGPFIVMLGKMTTDVVRFLYLYLEFYIPYACGFWMIFGQVSSITSMFTVDAMLFSLFRITLVDDYQYDEMESYDIVMAYILIGTFLGVSAILCINLFIALMSDTFQRVYDNANANAVMQQATLLLTIEENQSSRSRNKFKKYIQNKCSPEDLFYDDDLTVAQDEDLKKVTIKIKEQMDELMEKIDQGEMEKRLMDDKTRGKRAIKGGMTITDVLGMAKNNGMMTSDSQDSTTFSEAGRMMRNVKELSIKFNEIQLTQNAQESLFKDLKSDNDEIKHLLKMLVPGSPRLGSVPEKKEWGQRQQQQVTSLMSPDLINLSPQQSSAPPQKRTFFKSAAASLKQSFGAKKKNTAVFDLPTSESSDHHIVEMVSLPGAVQSPASSIGRQGGIETSQSSDLTVAGVRTAEITTRRSEEGRAAIGEGLDDSIA